MGQQQHALDRNLERLSTELSGQPEPLVLEALRNDPELATWGWTDARLSVWSQDIAGRRPALYRPNGDDTD